MNLQDPITQSSNPARPQATQSSITSNIPGAIAGVTSESPATQSSITPVSPDTQSFAPSEPATPVIREAIILAGGLGTRLRSSVPDLPKCMAPVAGRPFIAHVIEYCLSQGIQRFIFALGYKSDYFDTFLETILSPNQYAISREAEPLGTGGAIRLAARQAKDRHTLALNGDTFFGFDLAALSSFHLEKNAHCSLSLKPMQDFDRYGSVTLGPDNDITAFQEKQYLKKGIINAGVYALDTEAFLAANLPEKCSFEKDYLEAKVDEHHFFGLTQDAYFIDIGIPQDYERAQTELAAQPTNKRS